jgi:hypothetical protein
MKNCDTELKAKVIALNEGLEPTEVVCPVKEFCKENYCVFVRDGGGDIFVSDEIKLMKLREGIKEYLRVN